MFYFVIRLASNSKHEQESKSVHESEPRERRYVRSFFLLHVNEKSNRSLASFVSQAPYIRETSKYREYQRTKKQSHFPRCFDINYSFKLLLHIYFRYSFSPSFFLGYIRVNKIITTFPRRHDSKIVPYVLI